MSLSHLLQPPHSKPSLLKPPPKPPLSITISFTQIPLRTPILRCTSSPSRSSHPISPTPFLHTTLPSLLLLLVAISLRFILGAFPSDFPDRWRRLLVYSEQAELACREYPSCLMEAVVASEDSRFFRHLGVDPVGIARAVVNFPRGGGGSTITQQLVKNVFLKSERRLSRKIVEMVLAMVLERRMSKWKILCSYLSLIYWGHGLYGIEAASLFYFGKLPLFLSLGESAMLAALLPAPELRSPLNDPSSGKLLQVRVLKRMVSSGFLDVNSAILVLNQPLYLNTDGMQIAPLLRYPQALGEESGGANKQMTKCSAKNSIWDWELASRLWEAREDLEIWATRNRIC